MVEVEDGDPVLVDEELAGFAVAVHEGDRPRRRSPTEEVMGQGVEGLAVRRVDASDGCGSGGETVQLPLQPAEAGRSAPCRTCSAARACAARTTSGPRLDTTVGSREVDDELPAR